MLRSNKKEMKATHSNGYKTSTKFRPTSPQTITCCRLLLDMADLSSTVTGLPLQITNVHVTYPQTASTTICRTAS